MLPASTASKSAGVAVCVYRYTDMKVSSQSCNTGQKIQPELQQETEDTDRATAGDRE
jgi:hypothetical protein